MSRNAEACLKTYLSGPECAEWNEAPEFATAVATARASAAVLKSLKQTFKSMGVYVFSVAGQAAVDVKTMTVVVTGSGISCPASTGADGYVTTSTSDAISGEIILLTVTFCANPANDLTCPPSYILL